MARKYNLISELYDRTCKTVVANPQNWQNFLQSACRNYKLRYDEQLLIYAQRPDATAVLEIERWNRNFGRWVNRGARGIAVFADEDRKTQRLSHYFDISDTHEGRYSRPIPLWAMQEEYTEAVIETLENTFGQLTYKSVLSDAVMSAAQNAAEDNLPDYLQDLLYVADNSFLAGLDEGMITTIYKKLVTNSVAYMMMARLGINVGEYFEAEDFRDVTNFNTQETLNALGFATSDIAEMGLSEISKTIRALSRNNRIIEADRQSGYNRDENTTERSGKNERDHIHDGRGLQPSGSDLARTAGAGGGQMVTDEENISQGTAQSPVLQSPDERNPDKTFVGSTAEGKRTGGNTGAGDGSQRGTDRTDESRRHDELGSADEQHQELGSGDRESTGHLRLEHYDRNHEDKSLPFFHSDKDINEILRTTPHLSASLEEIKDFYERTQDNVERTEFIKSIFNHDYTELTLEDGRTVGYKTFQNVLHLWEGHYENRTKQSYYDWDVIAQHFEAMRLLGELNDRMKPLPSMDGQLSFILDGQAREEKNSAFSFTQEIIDTILTRGNGFFNGKMQIYEQFEKSLSAKENVEFLKKAYGVGGVQPVITGTGIDEWHDGKGISLSRGYGADAEKIILKWTQVEKRIRELIRMDRYLNPKEKERYPKWLEEQEIKRAEMEEQRTNREILSTAPSESQEQTKETPPSEHYEYHLGDTVYIGASEYEILSFDDERVMLYDMEMPLFNKEFTRIEFDEKVRENSMNDHLKVPDQKTVSSELLEQAKEIINEFCQNEYGSDADFSNLKEVGIAFTTVTDDEIPIQVNANLVDLSVEQYLDDKLIESTRYSLMEEMIESALVYLDFDDLTSIIIDRCTASVYRTYQQNDYTGPIPTLQDFRDELLKQDEPEAKEIALAIELFTHGSLNTFAKQTNVDTHNRLICYDILDLGKQLMPIGMLVVLDSILNRITQNRAKGKNTFIFIDEIYLLFQHEYSANFLFTLWKRVRKYCAYASGITQNVDDLLQSHTARTMLANSEFIIMLNQASTDRLELAKLLNISDLQLSYITNVDAGHGLIKVGSSLVPFANKFPKNTKLYKLMTTKPGEV